MLYALSFIFLKYFSYSFPTLFSKIFFSSDVAVDDSPEGLKFVPAGKSPSGEALLLAACEVGGTVAVYDLVRK